MALVCGVDSGSLNTLNSVAWLEDGQFVLDAYVPTRERPLPDLTVKSGQVRCFALAAPQGLPMIGETGRECDRLANTPTLRLPADRQELKQWRAHRGLIEVGVSVFWWVHEQQVGSVIGLPPVASASAAVCETYPRYVIGRMWPGVNIPSKKNAPLDYVDTIYAEIQRLGAVCRSVIRPAVDQVDAMVCALAAAAFVEAEDLPAGAVGESPCVDPDARVLRGGYIISP